MKKRLRNQKGYTLVELVAGFALVAIFMVAATLIMATFIRVYSRSNSLTQAEQLADTLAELIVSDVDGATYNATSSSQLAEDPILVDLGITDQQLSADHNATMWIIHDNVLCFFDENNYPVIMQEKDGYLSMTYPISDQNASRVEDWGLGKAAYKGFTMANLKFEIVTDSDGAKTNLLRISFDLTDGSRTFSTSRVVECYYLNNNSLYQVV